MLHKKKQCLYLWNPSLATQNEEWNLKTEITHSQNYFITFSQNFKDKKRHERFEDGVEMASEAMLAGLGGWISRSPAAQTSKAQRTPSDHIHVHRGRPAISGGRHSLTAFLPMDGPAVKSTLFNKTVEFESKPISHPWNFLVGSSSGRHCVLGSDFRNSQHRCQKEHLFMKFENQHCTQHSGDVFFCFVRTRFSFSVYQRVMHEFFLVALWYKTLFVVRHTPFERLSDKKNQNDIGWENISSFWEYCGQGDLPVYF